MLKRLKELFHGNWNWDFHGVNAGEYRSRVLTMNRPETDDQEVQKVINRFGKVITEFCKEAHRMQIRSYQHEGVDPQDVPPTVFLNIDEDELNKHEYNHLMCVDVIHKDGRRTRFQFSVNQVGTRVKATVRANYLSGETTKTVTGRKADFGPVEE